MKKIQYEIKDPLGIHARPAGLLTKLVSSFQSSVSISLPNGKSADAKRLFGVMGLGVKQGDQIALSVEGPDEAAAVEAFEKFLNETL